MKKADKILFDLMNFVQGGQDILIPNYYYDYEEMDLFRLTKSGYVYEYEIKISRSDFKADFKKYNGFYNRIYKHDRLLQGNYKANYFHFVCPEGMLSVDDVPKSYGLIYYIGQPWNPFIIIRPAKRLRSKFDVNYAEIAFKLSFREQNLRYKLRRLLKSKITL